MSREEIIAETIGIEGDFSDHPNDSGGATRYGITEGIARHYGYQGDMRDLPQDVAVYIYTKEYWEKIKGDEVLEISEGVAAEMFDTAVNAGYTRAIEFLQVSLNVLNAQETLYPDLHPDGLIGPKTLACLEGYMTFRKEETLVKAMNCLQGAYYMNLVLEREKDEDFIYGWLNNRVVI